ncbi:hypothetical protein A2U01_0091559, partial [Trifolium medium]|nr:hypothetical protein [Trifolium medium]
MFDLPNNCHVNGEEHMARFFGIFN